MGKKDVSLEQLALYQDCLLSGSEQHETERAASENPEFRNSLRELADAELGLREWGRRKRILTAVIQDFQHTPVRPVRTVKRSAWTLSFQPQWAASLAGVLILIWAAYALLLSDAGAAASLRVIGDVKMDRTALGPGAVVQTGSSIVLGADSYASFRMGDQHSVAELGPQTVATLDGGRSLTLQKGVVWNRVAADPNDPYLVHTPHGTVRVLGTEFEVEVKETESIVRVKSGTVEVCSTRTGISAKIEKGCMGRIRENTVSKPETWVPSAAAPWRERFSGLTTQDIYRGLRQSRP